MNSIYDCYTLSNGVRIPCVGYGTYKAADGNGSAVIRMALEAGYRYFDTASFYQTETYVAQALRDSGISRSEVFLASKMWKDEMGYAQTKAAFQRTLERLETDYLDLYLIHWPRPDAGYGDWKQLDLDTWRAMEELYEAGKIRAIGLSNFLPQHIENLLQNGKIAPMVNQIEFHPGHTQEATVRYCQAHGIQVQAWSPMGRTRVLKDPLVQELAQNHGVSAAQICLRYAVQRQIIPLPKASSMERMKQNQDLFSFELTQEEMFRLDTMPPTGWSGQHPDL
ncbi:MAG: aldo/keto reductase [Butyricicoccus sp.]|nr:aldo/keto reductase [Butyricicoccus sp.]